jgi:hypothetical protein
LNEISRILICPLPARPPERSEGVPGVTLDVILRK